MVENFQIPQQMINTLNGGGVIAAYDQAALQDSVAWVAVLPRIEITLSGRRWLYDGAYIEVTYDSYETVERMKKEQLDFEEYNILMVTKLERALLSDVDDINKFFSLLVAKPEFVRGGDYVNYPDDFRHIGDDSYIAHMIDLRMLVGKLLEAKRHKQLIQLFLESSVLVGNVEEIKFMYCEIYLGGGQKITISLWNLKPGDVRLIDDGYVSSGQRRREMHFLDASSSPVWNFTREEWYWLPEDDSAHPYDVRMQQ